MEIDENEPAEAIALDDRKNHTSKSTLRAHATCAAFHSRMKEYFNSEKYTDVSIACQDRVFKCHRLVLAAASEYFDAMFCGNFKESCAEDVVLHDISHSAFESALHYMYTGIAPVIGDENVYDLLRTATILNLRDIEERCIHYLCERNVPINYAVEIYLLACVIGNKVLISCASQCILKHLPRVSLNDLFLRMSFKELETLLEFTLPDRSPEKEYILLNTICRWVSNQTCLQEEKESLFLKLTQNVCFQHIPVLFSDVCRGAAFQPDHDVTDSDIENLNPSLYVYVGYSHYYSDTNNPSSSTALFSLEKSGEKWHQSHEIVPPVTYMRTVVHDNQLYSFQFDRMHNSQFVFKASPSVDFSENVRLLTRLPLDPLGYNADPHLSMCCQKNSIYACSKYSKELFHYNCEQDEWFPISFSTKADFLPALITMCHNQLYIMGSELNSDIVNILQTYDHRTGKLEAGSKCNWHNSYFSEICTHRERIYLSKCSWSHVVVVYNPVANKWDQIFNGPSSDGRCFTFSNHRLASFENKLWAFTTINRSLTFSELQQINIAHYDSFVDEWETTNDYSLNVAGRHYDFSMEFQKNLTDVIVYKLPQ